MRINNKKKMIEGLQERIDKVAKKHKFLEIKLYSISCKSEENLRKQKVRYKVRTGLRNGTLIKKPCKVCGELKVEAHHPDYTKPFEVIWFCNKHHRAHHKKFGIVRYNNI